MVIAKSGSVQVNLSGSASVNSLTVTGDTLNVSGGTLAVAANSSIGVSSNLTLNDSTLSLASGMTLSNSGAITLGAQSQLNDGGAYIQSVGGNLTLLSATVGTGIGENLVGMLQRIPVGFATHDDTDQRLIRSSNHDRSNVIVEMG